VLLVVATPSACNSKPENLPSCAHGMWGERVGWSKSSRASASLVHVGTETAPKLCLPGLRSFLRTPYLESSCCHHGHGIGNSGAPAPLQGGMRSESHAGRSVHTIQPEQRRAVAEASETRVVRCIAGCMVSPLLYTRLERERAHAQPAHLERVPRGSVNPSQTLEGLLLV
jgi:hypothetical protein